MFGAERKTVKNDFAKIVRSTDGRQVLYYVEPNEGYFFLHQVIPCEGFQADMKIGFTAPDEDENERRAFVAFEAIGVEQADKAIAMIEQMMDGEE